MFGIERAHLVERGAGLGQPVPVQRRERALPGDLELGLGGLLLPRLFQDFHGVVVSRKHFQDLLGGRDRGIELARVEALRGSDEKPVRLDRGDAFLPGRGLRDDDLQAGDVHVGGRVLGLLHQLPRRGEPRVHLEDEVAPDQAVVDLAFLEQVQGVAERGEDLFPDFARQRRVPGVVRIGHAAHGSCRPKAGEGSVFWFTLP